jgi:hypothetical protein
VRDAADLVAGLKQDGLEACVPLKLDGGRQPGRASADDNCSLIRFIRQRISPFA